MNHTYGRRASRGARRSFSSLAKMNADRASRVPRPAPQFVPRPPEVLAAEAALRAAQEARAKAARDARVREEEREALLRRLAKLSAEERKVLVEEERILAWGRGLVARLKRAPPEPLPEWATELFGVVE